MIVYRATNNINGKSYIGLTKGSLSSRKATHLHAVRKGSGTYFHNAIRKYGVDSFTWKVAAYCSSEQEMRNIETSLISYYKSFGCYNLAPGGCGGYVVPDEKKDEWKGKLRAARKGRKPALGMKHSEENKAFFAECNNRKQPAYPGLDAVNSTFKDAHVETGISKTHFYRLRRQQMSTNNA